MSNPLHIHLWNFGKPSVPPSDPTISSCLNTKKKKAHINLLTNQTSNYKPTKPPEEQHLPYDLHHQSIRQSSTGQSQSSHPASSTARRASCSAWIWASTSSWPRPKLCREGSRDPSSPKETGKGSMVLELHPKLLRNLGTNRFCATPFRLNLRWWFFRHQAAELVGDSLVGDPVFQSGWRFAAYPNLLRLRGNIVERGHGKETRLCSKHKRPICEVAKHTWI